MYAENKQNFAANVANKHSTAHWSIKEKTGKITKMYASQILKVTWLKLRILELWMVGKLNLCKDSQLNNPNRQQIERMLR